MTGRKDTNDARIGETRWRSTADQRLLEVQAAPSEHGRYSSDQARYFGADNRTFGAPPLHRPRHDRPDWRRRRFDAALGEEPPFTYDEEDAAARGYYSLDGPHGGQEYGIEPHGYRERLVRRPPRRVRPAETEASHDDLSLDPHDPGVREFGPPADYTYHPDVAEFELDYLDWREEQLRAHDRDYAVWRAEQQQRYDRDYLTFRIERRSRFDRSFAEWRRDRDGRPPEDRV